MAKSLDHQKLNHLKQLGIKFQDDKVYFEDLLKLIPEYIQWKDDNLYLDLDKGGISYISFGGTIRFRVDDYNLLNAGYKTIRWLYKINQLMVKEMQDFEIGVESLTTEQADIARKLVRSGCFAGKPFYNSDKETLKNNSFRHIIMIDGKEVVTVRVRDGFEFTY